MHVYSPWTRFVVESSSICFRCIHSMCTKRWHIQTLLIITTTQTRTHCHAIREIVKTSYHRFTCRAQVLKSNIQSLESKMSGRTFVWSLCLYIYSMCFSLRANVLFIFTSQQNPIEFHFGKLQNFRISNFFFKEMCKIIFVIVFVCAIKWEITTSQENGIYWMFKKKMFAKIKRRKTTTQPNITNKI